MSEKDYFDGQSPVIRLRVWALGQMVWGAFMAGVFVVALGAVLLVIWGVSHLLDPRSKEMPSPYGMIEMAQPAVSDIV
jgi:Intrinsic membrane protein PufX